MRRNYCCSILFLWYPPSHSLWIILWTCMVSLSLVMCGELPSSGLLHYLWFISVCVGHLSAVFTPPRHCFYGTEGIFYFCAACPIYLAKVSRYYRPTPVDTASVHIVKGIIQNIHKIGIDRRIHTHLLRTILYRTNFPGPICPSNMYRSTKSRTYRRCQ